MRNYLTECIGTFFLVLAVGLSTQQGPVVGQFAPIAIGSALMIMVYMGGHISGGHYNPSVTLAVWLRGKLPAREVVPYWIAQIIGAVLAAFVVYAVLGKTYALAPGAGVGAGSAVLVEAIFAFALSIVVLNTATSSATAGNSYYGLAIGFTITVAAFCGGGISGGAFNPAVGTGPAIVSAITGMGAGLAGLWIYIVGPLIGGAVAAGVYRIQNPTE
jgi:aquaporin Z